MTAQKEEWVQVGCDVIYRSHTSSLKLLEKDLTFFTAVVLIYLKKSGKHKFKQDISPVIEDLKYMTSVNDIIAKLGSILPFVQSVCNWK